MNGRDLPQEVLPKAQFLRIIREASGVDAVWDTDDRPQLGQDSDGELAWIELGVSGSEKVGLDEGLAEPNTTTTPPTQNTLTVGHRHCVLNLMAYSIDKDLEAYDLCARVRMGFNRRRIHELMEPTIALRSFHPIIRLPKSVQDGRIMLRANMGIAMSYAVSADTCNAPAQDYVLSVAPVTGTPTP